MNEPSGGSRATPRARVGIVVPARNAEAFIEETLESIFRQAFVDWTCVVVDDGSSDDTAGRVERFVREDPRVALLRSGPGGPCAARNKGADALAGLTDYLVFMDADDRWLPHALTTLVTAAETTSEAIGAHGLGEFIDERGAALHPGAFSALGRSRLGCGGGWPRKWPADHPTTFENVVTQSVVFPPGLILVRASTFRQVGSFDDTVRYAEDWDILIRLARLGPFAFVDDVVLEYRRHDTNLGASREVAAAVRRVRQRAFYSPENTREQRRVVRDAWRAAQVIDGMDRLRSARDLVRRRRVGESLLQIARIPLLAARWLRGAPPRSGTSWGRPR